MLPVLAGSTKLNVVPPPPMTTPVHVIPLAVNEQPVRFVPVPVSMSPPSYLPYTARDGKAIVGGAKKVREFAADKPVPLIVLTAQTPEPALPAPGVAVMLESLLKTKLAGTPLNVTLTAPVKPAPETGTVYPGDVGPTAPPPVEPPERPSVTPLGAGPVPGCGPRDQIPAGIRARIAVPAGAVH